jgi:hypothetical protein
VEADNSVWVLPEPGAVRAPSVPLKLMDQARAWKHDKDLSNRLPPDPVNLAGEMRAIVLM